MAHGAQQSVCGENDDGSRSHQFEESLLLNTVSNPDANYGTLLSSNL